MKLSRLLISTLAVMAAAWQVINGAPLIALTILGMAYMVNEMTYDLEPDEE